jgi:hypothetical protein
MMFSSTRTRRLVLLIGIVGALVVPASAMAGPQANTYPQVTGETVVGSTLTCTAGAWSDSYVPQRHTWVRDGVEIPGSDGDTYQVTLADKNTSIGCREYASDGVGTEFVDSGSMGVTLSPPVATSDPTITGAAVVGTQLTCAGGTFSGDLLGAPTYEWLRDDGKVLSTAPTYTPIAEDADRQIRCRVTVANDGGAATAESSDVNVASGLPQRVKSPTIPKQSMTGFAIACAHGTWSGEGITFTYQWMLNDKPIKGATSTKLLLLDTYYEKTVYCRVTAHNANGVTSLNSNYMSPNHPAIRAPWAKKQPPMPKLAKVIAKGGITGTLKCNASCATETHVAILTTVARKLGIPGKDLGGYVFFGVGHAHRTFAGNLTVTTKFNKNALKGLRKIRGTQTVIVLAETAWGPKYAFKKYHVAEPITLKLRR